MNAGDANISSMMLVWFVLAVYLTVYPVNFTINGTEKFVQENSKIYNDDLQKDEKIQYISDYINVPVIDKEIYGNTGLFIYDIPKAISDHYDSVFLIIDLPPPSLTI